MAYLSLDIPPGVVRSGSQVESNGRWRDANLIRWHQSRLRPVGGWFAETAAMTGAPRDIITWSTNNGFAQMFIGTNNRLYQWTGGTSLVEISDSLSGGGTLNASMVTNGQTLTCATGGLDTLLNPLSRFKVTGGSSDGNVYTVSEVINDTEIKISETFAANETATITLTFLWTTGQAKGQANTGFGAGSWNVGLYGRDQTDASIVVQAGRWSMDNWGEDILGCFRQDGRIFYWDASGANYPLNGALVTNAPTGNLGIMVTQERIAMAFGAGGNTRKVQWSDQEDFTTWAVSATGEAGSFELQTTGDIQVGVKVRDSVLMITDEDCHELNFTGQPFIFGRRRISDTAGIVGPDAVALIENAAYWMGAGAFYVYNGGYIEVIKCDVLDYVYTDVATRVDNTKFSQITASENRKYSEVWWFYASEAGNGENDRYVAYSYREGWWTVGKLDRLSWDENNPWGDPFSTGSDYKLYRMEQQRSGVQERAGSVSDPGNNYGSNDRTMAWGGANTTDTMVCFAETGDIRVGDGSKQIHGQQVITDTEKGDTTSLQMRFYTSQTPDGTETDQGESRLTESGYSDVRFSGRYMRYRVEAPFDQDFRVGDMQLKAKTGGDR